MNSLRASGGTNRSHSIIRRSAGIALASVFFLGLVAHAPAQLSTNYWAPAGGGNWSAASSWSNGAVANSAGALVYMSGNTNLGGGFNTTVNVALDIDVTLGYLLLGDIDRGSVSRIVENIAAPTHTLTFDTGDGKMALLTHGSGDLNRNMGTGSDYINTRILVSDPQGLYIDNLYNLTLYGGATNARALDGGGHDIVKAEDGYLEIARIVTNVNNLVIRDGAVRFNYDNEINVNMRPDITNIVLGVAGGAIDTGTAHPFGVAVTNFGEGGAHDTFQMPMFEVYGINNTNSAVQMTNTYNLVMNRGFVRLYDRRIITNSVNPLFTVFKPALMSGSVTLNGHEDVNWISINAAEAYGFTSSTKRVIFAGPITGTGGFTKFGYSEMTLIGTNDFTGRVAIRDGFYYTPGGLFGAIALREGGMMTGAEGMTLYRSGSFYVDNSEVNIADRINDSMWLVGRGFTAFQIYGNASAASSESIGRVTNDYGTLSFLLDRVDGSPRAMTLGLAGLARKPGSIVQFISRDTAQGVFGTNVAALTVNIADGASLAQVGSAGGAGTTTRSVAIGVFGGDGMDYGPDRNTLTPTRADEFMTLDGTRLRTLDTLTEMVNLGGRTNLGLAITQASAPADANVNINFMATNLVMNSNHLINKTVQGAVTFNSIRVGIVSNWVSNVWNEPGVTLLISDEGRLTSESGMLLAGRDVGNVNGDGRSGANLYITRGTLDLDGTSGNREGIVQNESGQQLIIRSSIEAGNGLTKGGVDTVCLDAANAISGTVTVARGALSIWNGRGLGAATQMVVAGRSTLVLENGADVRGVDLVLQPDVSQTAVSVGSRVNTWGGDVIMKLVDEQGAGDSAQATIAVSQLAGTLNLLGDIGMDPSRLSTADNVTVDSPRWATSGSAGILNLYGSVGDFLVDGEAQTYNAAAVAGHARVDYSTFTDRISDENYVLRTTFDGGLGTGEEANYNIYNPWRAAGRLYASQGVIRYMGDPAAGKGDFYADTVLTNSNPERSSQTGFWLAGSSLDNNGHVMFLLTRDGQRLNAERWTVDNTTRNNTVAMGLEHFGPTNATVTIGNTYDDGSVNTADNRITMNREFRIFAHNGWDTAAGTASVGRVDVTQTLYGDGNGTLTKLGSGVVYLQGPSNFSYDEHNNLMTNLLLGGELVLDRRPGNFDSTLLRTRNSTAGTVLILAGGDVTMWGSTNRTVEYYSTNFVVRAGDSTIRSRTYSAAGSNELHIADNAGTTIARQQGGTVNFEKDLTAGGGAGFKVGTIPQRLGSWAVVSSNGLAGYAFAATDSGQWIGPAIVEADSYGAGYNTDVVPDFFGAKELSGNTESETLRFNADTGLGLNGWQYTVNHGGILVTPNAINYASNGAAAIANGTLISSNGEMIVHNYNTAYGFGIGAAITGNTAFTHSGTGNTTLSGANTFVGSVYLNGGTLTIDDASRLGNANNTLEMRGGVLNMTASMDLGYRTNVLGGNGGIYRVASNMTVRMSGPIVTETNWFGKNLLNSGHGDFIKEGAGKLIIGGLGDVTITNFNGTYEGLTDIREGTLEIQRQYISNFSNGVLGSSKSFYDGTIVRGGATLAFVFTNKWPTPPAADVTNNMPIIHEWMIFEQGATIRWTQQGAGYQGNGLYGVLDLRGDTVFSNDADEVFLGNYLMGSGALIVNSGTGSLHPQAYSPEFTGKIVLQRGAMYFRNPYEWAFPNASRIELGIDDNVNRGVVLAHWPGIESPSEYEVPQDIVVAGNSADTAIMAYYPTPDDHLILKGKLDLTQFDLYGNDRAFTIRQTSARGNQRFAYNGDSLQTDSYMSFLGEIAGGAKQIRTDMRQVNSLTLDQGSQTPAEVDYRFVVTFAGTNTGWTGSLEVGNREGTDSIYYGQDFDKQHVMRFGKDDGAVTWAIGSNNVVVLRHDAFLQTYGSQVTIGTLIADGNSGVDGFYGNQPVTNTWLENGGFNPGTLTIVQVTNKVFSGGIRNGEVHRPFATNSPAAALSLVKDGPASLTLIQSNSYSGSTRIMAGTLALTGTAAIAQSHTIQIDSGAFLNVTGLTAGAMTLASGQTLKGQGTFVGGLIVGSGSTVAPGSSPGVLTAQNDVTFESGSTFEVELIGTLAGEADQLLMAGASDTLTLGGATLSVLAPNVLPYGSSFAIIDGFSSLDSSRFAGLPNSGDTLTGGVNQFEIQYNANDVTLTVIPEPASLGLMGLMGIAGWLLRRRRR